MLRLSFIKFYYPSLNFESVSLISAAHSGPHCILHISITPLDLAIGFRRRMKPFGPFFDRKLVLHAFPDFAGRLAHPVSLECGFLVRQLLRRRTVPIKHFPVIVSGRRFGLERLRLRKTAVQQVLVPVHFRLLLNEVGVVAVLAVCQVVGFLSCFQLGVPCSFSFFRFYFLGRGGVRCSQLRRLDGLA